MSVGKRVIEVRGYGRTRLDARPRGDALVLLIFTPSCLS